MKDKMGWDGMASWGNYKVGEMGKEGEEERGNAAYSEAIESVHR